MTPQVGISVFAVIAVAVVIAIFRRDVVIGGFVFFFFVYAIFALIGYAFFPILSAAIGAYFGDGVLMQAIWFLCLSFIALYVAFRVGSHFVSSVRPIGVEFRPNGMVRLIALSGTALLLTSISLLFLRNYQAIAYATQFPGRWFPFLFKELPVVALVLYAVGRHHTRRQAEASLLFGFAIIAATLVIAIASRAGDRTDVLALTLGVVCLEGYSLVADSDGAAKMNRVILRRRWKTVIAIGAVSVLALVFMSATQASRARGLVGVPGYVTFLYNDYFPPAHMLFGAIALHWIRPADVLVSNLANCFYLGRVLDIPYLQQDLGNALMPGSSNRSFSFAYYIFTEGYMVAGWWGTLYNGIVPLVLLVPLRLLSRTSSAAVNALGAGIAAMYFANVARSQTALIPRYFLADAIPAILLFCALTGLHGRDRVSQ